jgi:hypothetical protein
LDEHAARGFEGTWSGNVDLNGTPVPIVLHIETVGSTFSVTADFPQHYRNGVALLDASADGDILRFGTRNMGVFEGRRSPDGRQIDGAFADKEQRYPLILRFGSTAHADPARPQTPKAPSPYEIEQVHVDITSAGCRLAGTLTIPKDGPIRAAALLITGSGAMDRDETVFGHKPFLVLADFQSRRGYAALRLDNRGVGDSTGDRATHTVDDDSDDMSAAVTFPRERHELRKFRSA